MAVLGVAVAQLTYHDFDLLIDRDPGGGYRARVLGSPGGQSSTAARFANPFDPLQLENFLLRIGARKRGIRSSAIDEMSSTIIGFGDRLFDAVFTGDVAGCLNRSLNMGDGDESGLRIRLRLDDCPELGNLPWEYLHDPMRRRFLCLSERTPLVRYLPLPEPVRPLAVNGPLRILAVIANPDADADALDTEAEWANLRTALAAPLGDGRIAVDRLTPPTLSELHRQLGRADYHVLHFIGHGRFNTKDDQGELLFEGDRRRPHAVSGTDLATLLHDHRSLRVAVLNACEGARTNAVDPFAGTAQTLIQQGVPAVVAMQFEISDQAAIAFSEGFYEAIAAGRPLDAATATGRTRVYASPNRIEWATPALYTRAGDTNIFSVTTTVVSPARPYQPVRVAPSYPEQPYVGRVAARPAPATQVQSVPMPRSEPTQPVVAPKPAQVHPPTSHQGKQSPAGYIRYSERRWALLAHYGGAAGAVLFGLLAPVAPALVFLAKHETSPTVRTHALAALRFQFMIFVSGILCFIVSIVVGGELGLNIGAGSATATALCGFVFGLIGGARARRGLVYRYPLQRRRRGAG